MSPIQTGLGLRLLAAFLMTAMSACVHHAAQTHSVGQIMFWRSALALPPIVIWAAWRGDWRGAFRTRQPRLHATRSLLGAGTMVLSFVSLALLPVATAQALAFLAPVFTLPLAAWVLREPLTRRTLLATALGLAGVPLLLGAALALPTQGALLGLAAGLAYALAMAFLRTFTKRMTDTETPAAIAFWFAVTAALAGLATLPFGGWSAADLSSAALLAGAGLLGGLGHIAANEAIARAPISSLAPLDFTALIWALGFDIVLFAHVPGPMALAGVAVITCAALLTVKR